MHRVLDALRSVPGRIAMTICGLAAVSLVVNGIGLAVVERAVRQGAAYLPILIALEFGILLCSLRGLRTLYGDAAKRLPTPVLIRAGMIGYAVNGLLPAGRAVAEATRASLVSGWVGSGRAAAAAGRMQAVALLVNAIVSLPAALALLLAIGPSWFVLAVAINGVVTFALGMGMLLAAKHWRIGAWLGRRVKRASSFGADLDVHLMGERLVPWSAIGWELCGRLIQVLQNGILVAAVGGAIGILPAFSSEGIHLVGASVGDLIPAQLGVMEGNFTLAAHALGLAAAAAVSIALLAHLTQLVWVVIGSLVPIAWRARKPPSEERAEPADAPQPPAPPQPPPAVADAI